MPLEASETTERVLVWQIGDAEISLTFLLVTLFCAATGGLLCTFFARTPRLREHRSARLAGTLGVVSGVGLYLVVLAASGQHGTTTAAWLSISALSGYAVIAGYLASRATLDAWRTLTTRIPGGQRGALLRPSIAGYQRVLAERLHELQLRPTDARLRKEVTEILLELGEDQAAAYHAYALAELLPPGPSHGLALYRLCQTLVDRLNRLDQAQPHLRKIIRLYPRSFFASYARRLVNHFEAYADREL